MQNDIASKLNILEIWQNQNFAHAIVALTIVNSVGYLNMSKLLIST